jgi:histidinol-phosphate phosphatase family protein
VRLQRGNADDALMRALHGPRWCSAAEVFPGRRAQHLGVTAAVTGAAALAGTRHRRLAGLAALMWAAGTAEFAYARIAPGPRNAREATTMVMTSTVIPPLAVGHWLAGLWRWRKANAWPDRPVAVLFDRDGTLVRDVPYNGDPDLVVPHEGAWQALQTLRERGVSIGVVSNQSGIGSGRISAEDVAAVNAKVDELLGPIGVFKVCPHVDADGCECRKPATALITAAAESLGVNPRHCVVIGDIGSDVEAAKGGGGRASFVPTAQTRRREVAASSHVARDLRHAVEIALRPQFAGERP